jgi:hypothetical protein
MEARVYYGAERLKEVAFRLFICANDKGGVGKSVVTSILFGYLCKTLNGAADRVRGIDSDPKNSSFHRKYPQVVEPLNIRELQNADALVKPFEEDVDIVVVDNRATAMSDEDKGLKAWIDEVELFKVVGEHGIGITFGAIVNQERENLEVLKETFDGIGERADWIVFRNFRGTDSVLWDTSNMRDEMLRLGISEIEMPLIPKHYERQMHVEKLALENVRPQDIADHGRKRKFIRDLYSRLEAIEPLLIPQKLLAARRGA